MAAPFSPAGLSADAPPFLPHTPSLLPMPAPPVPVCYVPLPAGLVPPPMGPPPCPFMGPPPTPGIIASPFHAPTPPPGFACPVRGPPPLPGFVANPFQGLPLPPRFPFGVQGSPTPPSFPGPFLAPPPPPGLVVSSAPLDHGMGRAPLIRMPHDMMARPAAPRAGVPPAGTWRAASGKARQKPMAPRQRRAAAKRAAALGVVTVEDAAHGGAAFAGEPSPRSVLDAAMSTPPGSPRDLQVAVPYPACPTISSAPKSGGNAAAMKSRRGSAAGHRGQPPAAWKQASGRGQNRSSQRPRRWFNPDKGLTTLMVRNIPNGFTREKVMNILDQHCAEENERVALSGAGVKSEYDFLYVPVDFKTQANKGYCFVNVTSPDAAIRLWTYLHGFRWRVNDSRKTCEVDYADIQGREKLVSHFSGSCFDCLTEEFLPVWFSPPRDGSRPAVVERHVVGRLGRRV